MDRDPEIDFAAEPVELLCLGYRGPGIRNGRHSPDRRRGLLDRRAERGQFLRIGRAPAVDDLHSRAQPRIAALRIERFPVGLRLVETLPADRLRAALERRSGRTENGWSADFLPSFARYDEAQNLREHRLRIAQLLRGPGGRS